MAISVNWITHVIFVPRTYMTLIQSSPVEIRELNTNAFRYDLRDLEDDPDGRPWPKTHDHNADVLVGGISLADVLLVLEPYTITFEDGQYAVYLQGTNNNILERTNKNQVSVNPSNSAGLVNSVAIEYGEFGGAVTIDAENTTGLAKEGSVYPAGTLRQPCLYPLDVLIIIAARGFNKINVIGDLDIGTSYDYRGITFIGGSITKSILTIESSALVEECEFYDAEVDGFLDGNSVVSSCMIKDLDYIYGVIESCILDSGTIKLGGGHTAYILDCKSGVGFPTIDCGGEGQSLVVQNYNGKIKLKNKTGEEEVNVTLNAGEIWLDSSISAGVINVSGVGELFNESTGTAVVNSSALISSYLIATVTWDTIYVDQTRGEAGTIYPIGTSGKPSNNLSDSLIIASRESINKFCMHGNFTLTTSFADTIVYSSNVLISQLNLNGIEIASCSFTRLALTGICHDPIQAVSCVIDTVTNLAGVFYDCTLKGTIKISATEWANISNCRAHGGIQVIIDMQGTGKVSITNSVLRISIINMTDPTAIVVKHGAGDVYLDASNTAGSLLVGGEAKIVDGGFTGITVTNETTRHVVWEDMSSSVPDSSGDILNRILATSEIKKASVNDTEATTTKFITTLTEITDDFWNRASFLWEVGNNSGVVRGVKSYNGTTKEISIETPLPFAPANGDTFTVIADRKYLSPEAHGGIVYFDINGEAGTNYPIGIVHEHPVNNVDDLLTIAHNRKIDRILLHNSITFGATHNISNMVIETIGFMGTNVTLNSGCSASNTAFRHLNLQGEVSNNDILLVEDCSIFNLENFSGVMQGVAFGQGSELSIGIWAEIYNCRAGGEPGNEPEINIGDSVLNIQQYRGNLKLTNKTGDNRTVISGLPTVLIIDSTCVAGIIQLIGIGSVEKDESGPGCKVDYDAVLTVETIVDGINSAIIEGALTNIEMKRIMFSAMAGLCGGGNTNNIKFRDLLNTKDRIDVIVDSHGNRLSITLDGN